MRYEGKIYRPPSEANSYLIQATIGCSWNACTYCDMYRDKRYRVRELKAVLEDIELASKQIGPRLTKVFVCDGDALKMPLENWRPILTSLQKHFPNLKRVSCYAMASNLLEKSDSELSELSQMGLTRLYIGPESGDDLTLKRIAKGSTYQEHLDAADKAHRAKMEMSMIALLGAGGVARSAEHAHHTAKLLTGMNPQFFAALTLTVVPGTPIEKLIAKGKFELPSTKQMLGELRTMVDEARPTHTMFRTNHASNYLPLAGYLPDDRHRIVQIIDAALSGQIALRPEYSRGL